MAHITAALLQEPLVEPNRKMQPRWYEMFRDLDVAIDAAPQVAAAPARLTGQAASLPATAIETSPLAEGLYRATYYISVTTPATVSSSVIPTLTWVTVGVTQTFSGAALVGNTTTTYQTASVLIEVDANSDVSYSTTYVSVGATDMQYRLSVILEVIPTA